MVKQTVKSARLYIEDNNHYLDILYEIENDRYVSEVHLPKVRLPIEFSSIEVEHGRDCLGVYDRVTLDIGNRGLRCDSAKVPESPDKPVMYTEKIIKNKVKKMTKEDIEKELGYPIEIVKKEN